MGSMEEKDPRFKGIEKKVGIFIAVAVIFLVLSIVFIGLQREIFTAKSDIYFIADSGSGLVEGNVVKFKGFRIGKIEDVILNDSGKVEVRLSILEEYLRFIKADSIATLRQEGVIGDYIISVSQGSDNMESIYDGGGIFFEKATSLEDIANDIKGQAESAIEEIKSITRYVSDPEGDIKQTIKNVRVLTGKLDNVLDDVSATLNNTTTTLEMVQESVIPQSVSLMDTSENSILLIQENLEPMMENADKSMANVLSITEDIKASTHNIPYAMEQGMELMEDTSEIMDSAKKSWPLNKNIEQDKSGVMPVDSYE